MKNSRDKRTPRRTTTNKGQSAILSKKHVEKMAALDLSIDTLSDSHTVADSVTSGAAVDEDLVWTDETDLTFLNDLNSEGTLTMQKHSKLLADAVQAASEVTTEKRTSSREVTLRRLYKALSQYSAASEENLNLIDRQLEDVILPSCLHGIDRASSSPAEQYAACRCLEALSITLGFNRDEQYGAVEDTLRRAVMATGRAPGVRSAAMRALCLTSFICCSGTGADEESTTSLLSFCESVSQESWRGEKEVITPPALRSAALDCWALLSTSLEDVMIAGDGECYGRGLTMLPLLQQCLEHESSDLRVSAGECVALIHESRLSLGIAGEIAENASERRYRHGSWDGTEWEVLMDELKQKISFLSVQSGRQLSKKAKKEQRKVFRDFAAMVMDDEAPHEVINVCSGYTMTLVSWREIIQLNFTRRCLQGGFQAQLMANPTLWKLFGIDEIALRNASASSLSPLEKRLTISKMSDAAKAADRRMIRQRRSRHNAKNHFFIADGENV